jgi:hypothetical protein
MKRILLAFLAAVSCQTAAFSQTTFATITGLVTDANGGIVVGANATATLVSSGYKYTAKSNDSGYYTIGQLLEGVYNLQVEAPGFKTYKVDAVRITNQELRRLDVQLQVGEVTTSVEVTGTASLIQTEDAKITDNKDSRTINELPLNQRSLWDFVGQNPGIVQAASGTATRRFSGSRNNQSDASVDGITVSNGRDGTQITPLVNYIESMAEVRVDMANNSAEFGALGQVTVISKSGTNELHGSGFDYYQTPAFVSRNPFASSGSAGITHWPGVSLGGPMWLPHLYHGKNKTFFFGSFETSRGSQVHDLLNPTVPLAAWRNGDFSGLSGTVVKDPFNSSNPFPGNIIPTSRINATAQQLQNLFYPLPNYGNTGVFSSQNYRIMESRPFDPATYWTTRIDHRISDRDFIFGRFTWARQYSRGWDDNLPTIGRDWNQRENQGANVSYTHTFTPTLVNEFRWGVAYNDQPRNGPVNGLSEVNALGLQGLSPNLPDEAGLLNLTWSGLGIQNLTQQVWRHPGYKNKFFQWQDSLSWYKGRHQMKAGVQIGRVFYADGSAPTNLFGAVTFSNRYTGYPYADFLLGVPTSAAKDFNNFVDQEVRYSYEFYVTDEFKATPTLTITYGLRYQVAPVATNTQGYNAIFDIGTGKIVVPNGSVSKVSSLLPTNYVTVETASQAGLPQSLIYTDKNNFAPRLGIAWRPFGNNTVFRAGYGIFYDIVPETPSINTVPFVISQPSYTNTTPAPTVVLPLVYPSSAAGPTTVSLPTAVNPNVKIPYSMQYNVTIEHQMGNNAFRLSYIGTNTREGVYGYNINSPIPNTTPFINKGRLFQTYPAITYLTNGAGHQYNAVTAETKRHTAIGLSYQLSYTLARDIGDAERDQTIEDPFSRLRDRGPWVDIPKNMVTGNVIYDLPIGQGRKFLSGSKGLVNALAGGWSLSLIYTYHSGRFLTPLWTGSDPTNTTYTTSATPASVTIRPNCISNPNLPSSARSINNWFNLAAFTAPTPGSFGSCGNGVVVGPSLSVMDAGLFKSFKIKERWNLRWEMTAVNILNHPNYNDPSMNITSAGSAGVITGVGGASNVSGASSPLDPSGARAFRTGLRVEF